MNKYEGHPHLDSLQFYFQCHSFQKIMQKIKKELVQNRRCSKKNCYKRTATGIYIGFFFVGLDTNEWKMMNFCWIFNVWNKIKYLYLIILKGTSLTCIVFWGCNYLSYLRYFVIWDVNLKLKSGLSIFVMSILITFLLEWFLNFASKTNE